MILVTGASGFIGSHVLGSLLKDGVEAVGLDLNAWSNYRTRRPITETEGRITSCDIRDAETMAGFLSFLKPSAVIHLAAKVGVRDSLNDPVGYLETNVIGTQNLLDACVKAGVKTVVLASTSSVYGNIERQVETAIPEPRSPYAASKLGMEALGRVYHELYGMNIACLRLFSVYGERVRPDLMINQIMHSLVTGAPITRFNGGQMQRDWTYVGDVVRGIRAALNLEGFEIINIGRGNPILLNGIITWLEAESGLTANIIDALAPSTEPVKTSAIVGKAWRLLDWEAEVQIEEGLRRTWTWYRGAHLATEPTKYLTNLRATDKAGKFIGEIRVFRGL